jgi:anthranilate synthase component 2
MIRILLINNYDSFVYNVKQLLDETGLAETTILLNDAFDLNEVEKYDRIVISPGPGIPSEAGNVKHIIENFKDKKPILGICLGFQAIGEVFGAQLIPMQHIYHGHQSKIIINEPSDVLFNSITSPFFAGRYHSWALDKATFPEILTITSETEDGIVMSFKHRDFKITGVLFHPESIMTPEGKTMIRNWLLS